MRNRSLHAALRDFALEAAAELSEQVQQGAELGYEVAEQPGTGAVLYQYRALTAEFIAERWRALAKLPAFGRAVGELGAGAAAYLRLHGIGGADPEPALRALLERLYEDATSFEFPEERFERVYGEVERSLFDGTTRVALVVPLRAVRIEASRIEIAPGAALVRGEAADAPREAVWPHPHDDGASSRGRPAEPSVLLVLERDGAAGEQLSLERVRARVADLVRALRLFRAGALAPGGCGWLRSDEGPWQPFDLDGSGPGRGAPWSIEKAEQDELREFVAAVERARVPGRVAWALERFELGCERARDGEALSDHLMALRALLDASDDAGRASLSLRLAALCAEQPGRRAVQRRTELAFALERFLVAGGSEQAYVDEVGSESPALLTREIEGHVRALLRDVLCGYLDPDLKRTADDILLTTGAPVEIEARDLRVEQPELTAEPVSAREPKPVPVREPEPGPDPVELADGVTPSTDWGFDDADCYSAPV